MQTIKLLTVELFFLGRIDAKGKGSGVERFSLCRVTSLAVRETER